MLVSPIIAGFTGSLGASAAFMGIVSGLMSACSLFVRPIAGNLADRVRKRRLATVGALLMCISSLLYGVVQTPVQVAVLRLVSGAGYSSCSVCMSTWFASLLPPDKIGSGMGRFGMMNALGNAIGPALGLAVYGTFGYRPALMLGGVLAGISVVLVRLVHDDGDPVVAGAADTADELSSAAGESATARTGESAAAAGKLVAASSASNAPARRHAFAIVDRRVIPAALVIALFTIPYTATQSFIVSIVEARGLGVNVSLFFPVYAVVLLVLRYVLKQAFDTVRFGVFLAASSVSALVSFTLLSVMQENITMFVAAACMAGGYGVMCSVCQSTAVRLVGPEHAGMANSTYYMGFDMGTTIGSVLGGVLFGSLDVALFYPVLALCVPAAIVVFACSRGLRRL